VARRSNLRKRPRNPRLSDKSQPPAPVNLICTGVQHSGNNAIFTFNNPIVLGATAPAYTVGGLSNLGILNSQSNSITLIYSAVTAGLAVVIPAGDPGIRSRAGGYVNAAALTTT
jgi:hypothetical protein